MKKHTYLLIPSIALLIFIIFTILVKTVEVALIQFDNSCCFLGFSTMNFAVNDFVKTLDTDTFHMITNILLFLAIATVLPFAVMGIIQLVVRKSLKKVDPILYFLLAGYVAVAALYFIFEIVKINYSPLSVDNDLKPSYPSSHIFIFIAILFINLVGLFHYLNLSKVIKIVVIGGVSALSIVMIIFRLFSGHHYLTDVIGAILLSAFVISSFYSFICFINKPKEVETVAEE